MPKSVHKHIKIRIYSRDFTFKVGFDICANDTCIKVISYEVGSVSVLPKVFTVITIIQRNLWHQNYKLRRVYREHDS